MVKILQLVNKTEKALENSVDFFFSTEHINTFSKEYGYDKCGVKKISASHFIHGFLKMFQEGKNNLRTLCLHIGLLADTTICQNSMESRFNRRTFSFVVAFLQQLMQLKVQDLAKEQTEHLTHKQRASKEEKTVKVQGLLGRFSNVLIADSTCQKLPSNLSGIFASSCNQMGSKGATMRLQVIYNYTKSVFSYFDLGNYRENDQSSSDNIFMVAQKGDLVLRDLGYFVLSVFKKMTHLEIFLSVAINLALLFLITKRASALRYLPYSKVKPK